jgi:hypothetical protein
MVRAAQADPVVARACEQLRVTRAALRLDDDEYAELLTRFVQQIPYGPVRPRFGPPCVVFADGHAVCADKSVLLASLLAHEGYGTAIVAIDENSHAAVALQGTGPGYLGTGYAYAETTADSFVGEVPPVGAVPGLPGARTQVVRITAGRAYRADMESEFVGDVLLRAERAARTLAPYRGYAQVATGESRQAFAAMAERQAMAADLYSQLVHAADYRAETYALVTRSGGR